MSHSAAPVPPSAQAPPVWLDHNTTGWNWAIGIFGAIFGVFLNMAIMELRAVDPGWVSGFARFYSFVVVGMVWLFLAIKILVFCAVGMMIGSVEVVSRLLVFVCTCGKISDFSACRWWMRGAFWVLLVLGAAWMLLWACVNQALVWVESTSAPWWNLARKRRDETREEFASHHRTTPLAFSVREMWQRPNITEMLQRARWIKAVSSTSLPDPKKNLLTPV